jgi:hypothetical protein
LDPVLTSQKNWQVLSYLLEGKAGTYVPDRPTDTGIINIRAIKVNYETCKLSKLDFDETQGAAGIENPLRFLGA